VCAVARLAHHESFNDAHEHRRANPQVARQP
jgi:hypothetical protein